MSDPTRGTRRRSTLADVAARAGVSKAAASFALNGRSGVSDATRQRVLEAAEQLRWSPNNAARALSGARSDAIGLVLARPARMLGLEPFYMEFISGIESVLAHTSTALLLKVVPDPAAEIATYRSWWASRRVDGVLVTDVRVDDARLPALSELDLPAVIVGGEPNFAATFDRTVIWTDDATSMAAVVRYLVGLGHRRLARISGPAWLAHCRTRTDAFLAVVAELGLEPPTVVEADFSGEQGAQATRQLLLSAEPPSALVFENDVMAVAALAAAREMGLNVPGDVSVFAWDDSPLCSLTHPAVTALWRDIPDAGATAARRLLESIDGAPPQAQVESRPQLVPRGSTAPPPEPPGSGRAVDAGGG